ncbi:MAG: phenylacetate--CoA ligase, partial [Prevotella sp.]|nr:phenylacetate--CoA ligase [Prevotella sp.]
MAYRRELPDWSSEYLDPELETMSREEIEKLQVERLRETVSRCMNNPVYRKRLEEAGVSADNITSVSDIRRIPFTTKEDLRNNYPFGLASAPLEECVRLHSSSGTTGNPTV